MPSGHPGPGAWELSTMERRYSVPAAGTPTHQRRTSSTPHHAPRASSATAGPPPHLSAPSNSEDLHAWSIYRQNLNSDFTDSALGSSEKSPLPYGNFQLRDSTVQSILSHPRYGPKSALGANMYTYLKFGLPRVFPPSRGPRDGSSGYDSSDDGSPHPRGAMAAGNGPYALRSRSDPDFRHPQAHHHRPYGGRSSTGAAAAAASAAWRARSSSEANLLSPDTVYRHHDHRRSMHDLRAAVDMHPGAGGRRSKAGSHVSLGAMGRRGPGDALPPSAASAASVAATAAAKMADLELAFESSPFAYPHLQVRGLDVESRSNRQQLLIQGVSLEIRGGETLAVMATSEEEGTVLLDAIAGCKSNRAGHVLGDILLNGQCVRQRDLRSRIAYVRSERALNSDLSVEQTLNFTNWLRRPGARATKIDTKDRMALLIEDLGLEQVRHTKVRSLTTSERRRLAVAVQLLLDTDILLLDRPTAGMDIFDTFFLIEFLRQWAAGGRGPPSSGISGRAVILTLHPPTYEIFTMLSRIALLSAGRLMFCGRRRDMLPYFANAEYPCPAYKNPSDYYLDLVTLDDLSAEAMLESSQRIEQLAEIYRRREEPLSDPGPPAGLPPAVRSANFLKQAVALLMCWWFWSQPAALSRWLSRFLFSVLISLAVGAIWWEISVSDPQFALGDRVGFLYATTIVAPWPLLLLMGVRGDDWRDAVASDIQDGLYGRFTFIVCKTLFSIPSVLLIWLAYLVPAYTMTGLAGQATDPNAFYLYIGYMLLYLCGLNAFIVALGVVLRCRRGAALVGGFVFLPMALLSGGLLHTDDLPGRPWFDQYAAMASPPRWLMPVLVRREYAPDVVAASVGNIMCRNKQVQHQDIIVQLRPCPPPNITAALRYHGIAEDNSAFLTMGTRMWPAMWPPIALAVFWGAFVLLTLIAFPINALRKRWHPPSRCVPNRP